MDQLVQQITARLYRRLNEEQPYFTPADLTEAGLPDFLVARIRLELERNLRDSIVPPESDWAGMSAPDVQQAWGLFLDAINGQVRLPGAFARGVVESAVADLVDLLSEPRKHLPGYLFGTDETLNEEQLSGRMRLMVVYPHLGLFAPRYLKKRGLSQLSRGQYSRLLTQLDERVCKGYSPLNWVQLLDPLFVLCGGEVEAELLARFFREKGLTVQAERLRKLPDPVDPQQLVELLSKPVFLAEPAEQADPAVVGIPASKPKAEKPQEAEETQPSHARVVPGSIAAAAYKKLREQDSQKAETAPQAAQHPEPEPEQAPVSTTAQEAIKPEPGTEPDTPDDAARWGSAGEEVAPAELHQKENNFPEDSAPGEEHTEAADEDPAEVPLYQRFAQDDDEEEEDIADHTEAEEHEDEDAEAHELPRLGTYGAQDDDEAEEESDDEEDEDPDFIPLWQRLRIDSDTPSEGDVENESENGALQPAPDNERFEALYAFLEEDEPRFLRDIFESDRRAYIGALERISGFDNWREAGKYLTNDIFRRYNVDMYKDVSIDFTDQLHRFFKNHV